MRKVSQIFFRKNAVHWLMKDSINVHRSVYVMFFRLKKARWLMWTERQRILRNPSATLADLSFPCALCFYSLQGWMASRIQVFLLLSCLTSDDIWTVSYPWADSDTKKAVTQNSVPPFPHPTPTPYFCLPLTANWICGREWTTVENILWNVSAKELWRTEVSNLRPLVNQSDTHPTQFPGPAVQMSCNECRLKFILELFAYATSQVCLWFQRKKKKKKYGSKIRL